MINLNLFVKFVQFVVKKWVVGGIDMILHFYLPEKMVQLN